MAKVDFKKQGKKNRVSGRNFELRVRKDLESKGWIVSKWQNNVEFEEVCKISKLPVSLRVVCGEGCCESRVCDKHFTRLADSCETIKGGKLVPAKPGRFRMMQTGFPDFIAYKKIGEWAKPFEEEIPDEEFDKRGYHMRTLEGRGEFIPYKKVGKVEETKTSRPAIEIKFTQETGTSYEVLGVEVKSNGYLSKEEKEKCKWLLENKIFGKILIASKGTKRGEIEYNEFE